MLFKCLYFFSLWSLIVLICFTNALPRGEYVNLGCSITLFWLGSSISSPGRYSYLSIFPEDNVDDFDASLSIPYCNFSSLNFSLIFVVSFYIISERFLFKRKGLSNIRVASITKKECGFAVHFYKDS